jgi:hypothetical protein
MPIKRASPPPLSPDLREILLFGPWKVGQQLKDLPPHNELRELWRIHEAALIASLPRGARAWFEDRDEFVRAARGEVR